LIDPIAPLNITESARQNTQHQITPHLYQVLIAMSSKGLSTLSPDTAADKQEASCDTSHLWVESRDVRFLPTALLVTRTVWVVPDTTEPDLQLHWRQRNTIFCITCQTTY